MPAPLSLAVAQPLTVPFDVAANALEHAAAIRRAGARVVVFPEMSLTGYELSARPVDPLDPLLTPIVDACGETETIALVGAPVASETGEGQSIGVLRVAGDGASIVYRKVHPGPSEIAAGIVAGSEPAVIDIDGWRLGLAVCRDTGVTQHARETVALGVDAYIAGVVHEVEACELQAERARAVASAHAVWTATAAFAGPTGEGYNETSGRSGIWSPDGSTVAEAGEAPGEVVTALLTSS